MRKVLVAFGAAALIAVSLAGAQSAPAVVGGTDDTTGRFPNVGVLQLRDQGEWFDYCSGTLVTPNVVLTAAHCVDFLGPEDVRVSFDAAPDAGSTYYQADEFVIHPAWLTASPCFGNSKHA